MAFASSSDTSWSRMMNGTKEADPVAASGNQAKAFTADRRTSLCLSKVSR